MNILPRCILAALLWASVVTAPNGKKPHGAGSKATSVGHPSTSAKTTYADAGKNARLEMIQYLARSLLYPKVEKVVAALTKIRDDFKGDPGKYGTEPLRLPSCFNPAYTHDQHILCLQNLWHTTQGQHSVLLPGWVKSSLKDLAHALAMGYLMVMHLRPPTNWYVDFAQKQEESLLTEIQPDNEWTIGAYKWLVNALENIQSRYTLRYAIHRKSAAEPLRNALSAFLCRLVADDIKPYVKGQRVTGGVATFEHAISRVVNELKDSYPLAVKISGFLQSSMLYHGHHFNPLKSMRESNGHHPGLRDIVTGLISVFDPPISTADRNNFARKWLIDSVIPRSDADLDKRRVSDRELVKKFSKHLMAGPSPTNLVEAVVISALLGLGSSQVASSRIGPISAQQVDEILEWEWTYATLNCLAALGRAEVSSKLVDTLDKGKYIPERVDRTRLKKEMEAPKAPAMSPWKAFVSTLRSWMGWRKPGEKKQPDAGAKSAVVG